jgi:hypothetical protein
MTQKTSSGYPNIASILALIGGILIMLGGMLLVAVSAFVLPYINYTNLSPPPNLTADAMPRLVSGIVGVMGLFGLISGVIVLASALMLRVKPSQRETWGILIMVFSVLSFLGPGGFFVGAIMGIVGGIMTLRWRPPTQMGSVEKEPIRSGELK